MIGQITVVSSNGVEMTTLMHASTDAQFNLAAQIERTWAARRTAAQLIELGFKPLTQITTPRPPVLTLIRGGLDTYDIDSTTIEETFLPPRGAA